VNLHIRMNVEELTPEKVLENIKIGEFKISNDIISIDPKEHPNFIKKSFYLSINSFNYSLKLMRIARRKVKRLLLKR